MLRGPGFVGMCERTTPRSRSTTATRDSVSAVTRASADCGRRSAIGVAAAASRNSARFTPGVCASGGYVGAREELIDRILKRPRLDTEAPADRPRLLEQLSVAADMREVEIREPRLPR